MIRVIIIDYQVNPKHIILVFGIYNRVRAYINKSIFEKVLLRIEKSCQNFFNFQYIFSKIGLLLYALKAHINKIFYYLVPPSPVSSTSSTPRHLPHQHSIRLDWAFVFTSLRVFFFHAF